jgi:NADH-quinone oxidoreductase subunit N
MLNCPELVTTGSVRVAMTINGLALLILGLFPTALLSLCQAAFV